MKTRLKKVHALRPMMKHQGWASDYCDQHHHPALFMEMRLGKTLVLIRYAKRVLPKGGRVLAIGPLTVMEAWHRELSLERETQIVPLYDITTKEKLSRLVDVFEHPRPGITWCLINYEGLIDPESRGHAKVDDKKIKRKPKSLIADLAWDVVACDESLKIAQPGSRATQICVNGFRRVPHRALLCGAPRTEGELQLFSPFQFLDGEFMGYRNFYHWRSEVFDPDDTGHNWQVKPAYMMEVRRYVHERAYVLRRNQAGIKDMKMPPQERHVRMNPAQRIMYNRVEKEWALECLSGEYLETMWATVKFLWLRQITGGHDPEGSVLSSRKADEVVELFQGELAGSRIVEWFAFKADLQLQAARLKKSGIPFLEIHGDVPQAERQKRLEGMRVNKGYKFLLATQKTAKYGVDASWADTAIYYSNEMGGDDRIQSEDRIINPTQTDPKLIIDLVMKDTIDEDIVAAVKDKHFDNRLFMTRLTEGVRRRTSGTL